MQAVIREHAEWNRQLHTAPRSGIGALLLQDSVRDVDCRAAYRASPGKTSSTSKSSSQVSGK